MLIEFKSRGAFLPGRRVLAVDDEVGITRLIKINLEGSGFQVHMASNGVEAMDMLKSTSYDLVITDILMPKMGGLELLAWLRDDNDLCDLPVILLTGSDTNKINKPEILGCHDVYMTKPFSPLELIGCVGRLLRTRRSEESPRQYSSAA